MDFPFQYQKTPTQCHTLKVNEAKRFPCTAECLTGGGGDDKTAVGGDAAGLLSTSRGLGIGTATWGDGLGTGGE
jgi:hypothetical protein